MGSKVETVEYFIRIATQRVGPMTLNELRARNVVPTTPVWKTGSTEWVAASEFEELKTATPAQNPTEGKKNSPAPTPPSGSQESLWERIGLTILWEERRGLVIAIVAMLLVVPLGYLAITSLSSGPNDQFAAIERDPDPEDIELAKAGKKKPPAVAAKKKRAGVGQKEPKRKSLVVAQGQKTKTNPHAKSPVTTTVGRPLTDRQLLAAGLSLDRFLSGRANGIRNRQMRLVAEFTAMGKASQDSETREIARLAAQLWNDRAASGTRVISVRRAEIAPEALLDQIAVKENEPHLHQLERRLGELWTRLLQLPPKRTAKSVPDLPIPATVRIIGERSPLKISQSNLVAINTSGKQQHHCVLTVTLESPWGLAHTCYFYRDVWKAGEQWPLRAGCALGKNRFVLHQRRDVFDLER